MPGASICCHARKGRRPGLPCFATLRQRLRNLPPPDEERGDGSDPIYMDGRAEAGNPGSVTAQRELRRRGRIAKPNALSPSNNVGASLVRARSIVSRRSFVVIPPLAENPPAFPPAASTRWQGTMIGNGLRPSA